MEKILLLDFMWHGFIVIQMNNYAEPKVADTHGNDSEILHRQIEALTVRILKFFWWDQGRRNYNICEKSKNYFRTSRCYFQKFITS